MSKYLFLIGFQKFIILVLIVGMPAAQGCSVFGNILHRPSHAQIVGWAVSNPSYGVTLRHRFEDSCMHAVRSLRASDEDDELLALTDEHLFV